MKFAAVVLLACVAVSSAAFTANLVQHTQPAVDKAMFNIRLVAGSNKVAIPAISEALTSITNAVQQAVQSLLQQAQEAAAHGQAIAQSVQAQLQAFAQVLQQTGSQAANQLAGNVQQFLAGLHQTLGGNKGSLSDALASAQQAAQNAFALAQQLVAQINLQQLLTNAINAVLPQNVAQLVIAHLNLNANNKGIIGDWFGGLFGGIGNIWNQVTGAAGEFAAQIASLAGLVANVGQSAFAEVQAQASQFLANVHAGASHMSAQAAQQMLSHIGDFQEALGNQYDEVVEALNNISMGNI